MDEIVTNEQGGKQSKVPFRLDVTPPFALLAIGEVLSTGSEKYGDWNWLNIPTNDHLNHALGHIFAYISGQEQQMNLRHAATRMLFALDMFEREEK